MSRFEALPRNLILTGDAIQRLRQLPAESVDSVLASPPYFRLRDYQVSGQIGLERHVDSWVAELRAVLGELHRVLVPTGTVWLNLGDSYATHPREGAPRKSLLFGPERLALRLIGDGWTIRNKIVWAKKNPVPSPVRDRLSASHEIIYLLAKQPLYYFALDAIRLPHTSKAPHGYRPPERGPEAWRGPNADYATGLDKIKAEGRVGHPLGKNPGDVWTIASTGYRAPTGSHHATFPIALADRAIRAGTPEARCSRCRAPWIRPLTHYGDVVRRGDLVPICSCSADPEPGVVLDPFMGSGTTAVAAEALGRDWLGVELNPSFVALAEARIQQARQGFGDTPGHMREAAA